MDEGTSIQCEVVFLQYASSYTSIVEDEDGDQWEVETNRLSSIIHNSPENEPDQNY